MYCYTISLQLQDSIEDKSGLLIRMQRQNNLIKKANNRTWHTDERKNRHITRRENELSILKEYLNEALEEIKHLNKLINMC